MTSRMQPYNDFLGLDGRRFADARLVVFTGVSGSGKSTAIRYLLENHPDYDGLDYERIDSKPLSFEDGYEAELLVVDELLEWREFTGVPRLLASGHRLIVASHLPERALKAALIAWRGEYFRTDDDPTKIESYLESLGVSASEEAVARFCETYGATFTDIDIILERYPDMDFDSAFRLFERFCRLES